MSFEFFGGGGMGSSSQWGGGNLFTNWRNKLFGSDDWASGLRNSDGSQYYDPAQDFDDSGALDSGDEWGDGFDGDRLLDALQKAQPKRRQVIAPPKVTAPTAPPPLDPTMPSFTLPSAGVPGAPAAPAAGGGLQALWEQWARSRLG